MVIIRPEILMFGIRSVALVAALACTVALVDAQNTPPVYRQPNAPIESRVADLLSRMTLAEKVAQLQGVWNRKREIQGADGRFDPARAATLIGAGIGQVGRPSEIAGSSNGRSAREQAEFVNAVQRWLIENTRLGIPAMFSRGGAAWPHRAGRDPLSSANRPGQQLGSGTHRAGDERGRAGRPRARRAARAVAGRRSRS